MAATDENTGETVDIQVLVYAYMHAHGTARPTRLRLRDLNNEGEAKRLAEGEGAHACSREQACARAPYISKRVLLNGMQVFGV
jgi:hypothetical protein